MSPVLLVQLRQLHPLEMDSAMLFSLSLCAAKVSVLLEITIQVASFTVKYCF